MKSLHEIRREQLEWVQPLVFWRAYELIGGSDRLASLVWRRSRRIFGKSVAMAETTDGQWEFTRTVFTYPRVTVRPAGESLLTAELEVRWGGSGQLVFADQRQYTWLRTDRWGQDWKFIGPDGSFLLQFGLNESSWRRQGHLQIAPWAFDLPELGLLATLGWYLVLLLSDWADPASLTIEQDEIPVRPSPTAD